jgi:cytochrome c oxidase assembly protein subunit 11
MSAAHKGSRQSRPTALIVLGVVVLMGGLSYASVPLYQMFCRATGYGGTTQVATQAPLLPGQRVLNVRFDSNVANGLPWRFEPEVSDINLRTGDTATVFFKVTNQSSQPITATAAYNVTPDQVGAFFNKISCFCFSEQTLGPHESAELPVVFYLDPALEHEESMKEVEGITLSYTFFPAKLSRPAVVSTTDTGRPKL